jgi:cellulose synthase/poly-beta-1,6-N-acetylglucosamine synthase-like glycosyltransferase
VIIPCRGIDQGFSENIRAVFHQDYPDYEIVFVTDEPSDPCVSLLQQVIVAEEHQNRPAKLIFSGKAIDSGQKVHNLIAATDQLLPESEVVVFLDSDARPHEKWLLNLVGPLLNERLGATTGYRWFIPVQGGFASHLRSVWNASIASALGRSEHKNFCWGGSSAIRRSTFDELKIRDRWRGTVSDDFALTRALQESHLPIHFVSACLVPSFEDCCLRELVEFTNRQLKITRVYAPHLWKPLLIGSSLFVLVFFVGLLLLALTTLEGHFPLVTLSILLVIFFLGAMKAYIRFRSVSIPLAEYRTELRKSFFAHLVLWPIASLLYLINSLTAAFSQTIDWRGISYELKSPNETVIISRD